MSDNACLECSAGHAFTPSLVVFMLVIAIAVGSAVIFLLASKVRQGEAEDSEAEDAASEEQFVEDSDRDGDRAAPTANKRKKTDKWSMAGLMGFVGQFKILISTYQIVSSTSSTFQVTMPLAFTKLMDGLSFVNSSISSIFPLGCAAHYNFVSKLFINTLAPVVIGVVLTIAFLGEYLQKRWAIQNNLSRRKGEKRQAFESIKNKYFNLFLYISFLLLPGVSTIIFQTFSCTEVDPNGEDTDNESLYLTADTSISCHSNNYKGTVAYACLCVLVYPVAVPLVYFWLLYQSRQEISSRQIQTKYEDLSLAEKYAALEQISRRKLSRKCEHMTLDEQAEALNRHSVIFQKQCDDSLGCPRPSSVVMNPLVDSSSRDSFTDDYDDAQNENNRSSSVVANKEPTRTVSDKTKRLSFLYDAYALKYW
jgi:hypothetical protein